MKEQKLIEPIRHQSSERNRRKMEKLCRDLTEELLYLYGENTKMRNNLEYAIGRAQRILNRARAK